MLVHGLPPRVRTCTERWHGTPGRSIRKRGRTVDIVGIGTDFSHNHGQRDLDWMRKGHWTRPVQYGAVTTARAGPAPKPAWFQKAGDLAKVPAAMAQAGFNAEEVETLAAGNWLRLYGEVFG